MGGGGGNSWIPIVAGAIGTIVGGPLLGAALGAAAGGVGGYQDGGTRGALLGGATGALSGYGAGSLLQGGIAGGTAAGPGFLSKAGGIAQGAVFGTAGSGANAQSLLRPASMLGSGGGASTGLLGPGTLLGGSGLGSKVAQGAMLSSASNVLAPAFSGGQSANYSSFSPYGGGYSFSTPSSMNWSTSGVRPTPTAAMGGFSNSYAGEATDLGTMSTNFDYLIPGMRNLRT